VKYLFFQTKHILQMKHLLLLAFLGAGICCLTQCADMEGTAGESAEAALPTHEDSVKRGAYLVHAMGCRDCHSPKRMGAKGPEDIPGLELSGYQASIPFTPPPAGVVEQGWVLFSPDLTACAGPWGVSFAANLTPDATGIGNWSLDQFMVAIRDGKSKGLKANRDLLPPMPWTEYRNLNDDDLAAIFSYLKSTKAVQNVGPPPVPPAAPAQG
jgi:hypothetical protein